MAQQNRTVLKSYFETGDKPTENQFIDLIDSMFNFSEDSSSSVGLSKSSYTSKSSAFTHSYSSDTMIAIILIKRTAGNPLVKCGTSLGDDDIFKQKTIDPIGLYYTITIFKSFLSAGTLYFSVSGGTINLNIFYLSSIM